MLFRVILGVVLAALSQDWSRTAASPRLVVFSTAALCLFPAAVSGLLAAVLLGKKRRLAARGDGTSRAVLHGRFRRGARVIEFLVPAAYGVSLFAGWNALPTTLNIGNWALASGAVLLLPFVISLVLTWSVLHIAEVALIGAGPTLRQRLSFKLRQSVLTVCVPVAVVLALYDAAGLLPAGIRTALGNPWVGTPVTALLALGGYTVAPLVIARIWKTSRLPACPLRERLTDLCRKIGVTFRDIRVWETPGHFFANAAVMGLAGFTRYIIISRSLLAAAPEEELEAIFAHELGHAKRHHMILYLVLAADFMLLAYLLESVSGGAMPGDTARLAVWIGVFAAYWGAWFGYVSRTFERDADFFAAKTIGDYGTFAKALARIARLNGQDTSTRSWRHGSIRWRIEFLQAAGLDEDVRRRFLVRLEFVRTLLVTTGVVTLAAVVLLALLQQ